MSRKSAIAIVGSLALLVSASALAQTPQTPDTRGAVINVQGGGFTGLTTLDEPGSADFKPGFNVGGGLGYQFNSHVALRGNLAFARAEARGPAVAAPLAFSGTKFDRYYYGADLQVLAPLAGGVTPYVFGGGGAVTVRPDVAPAEPTFTKGAGKVGVGVNFQIPHSTAAFYAEGAGWIYKWDRLGFDKTQFDLTWSGGITYRFGR
jgi:opacity protein-like surface antigen